MRKELNEIISSEKYDIHLTAPEDREWGLRDFTFLDPSGILWIVENTIWVILKQNNKSTIINKQVSKRTG